MTTQVTKDFDAERTSTNGAKPTVFTLGGKQFTIRQFVSAEVLGEFSRREVGGYADLLDSYDEFVKACIEPGQGEQWDKIRKEADPPITVGAVEEVVDWIMGEVSARPTAASSSSRPGRGARQGT